MGAAIARQAAALEASVRAGRAEAAGRLHQAMLTSATRAHGADVAQHPMLTARADGTPPNKQPVGATASALGAAEGKPPVRTAAADGAGLRTVAMDASSLPLEPLDLWPLPTLHHSQVAIALLLLLLLRWPLRPLGLLPPVNAHGEASPLSLGRQQWLALWANPATSSQALRGGRSRAARMQWRGQLRPNVRDFAGHGMAREDRKSVV